MSTSPTNVIFKINIPIITFVAKQRKKAQKKKELLEEKKKKAAELAQAQADSQKRSQLGDAFRKLTKKKAGIDDGDDESDIPEDQGSSVPGTYFLVKNIISLITLINLQPRHLWVLYYDS